VPATGDDDYHPGGRTPAVTDDSERGYRLPPRERPMAAVYDAAYSGVPNWDVGRPQRPFVALAAAGLVADPVLDLGCGTGELAVYLARRGHRVLGVDISGVAVARARAKAAGRRVDAQFLVWDALELTGLAEAGLQFGTVLDSATFHVLGDAERDRVVAGLETVVRPGGLYCVLGDARRDPRAAYGVTPAELRSRFGAAGGWTVEFAVETVFERRHGSNPAYFVGLRRER
jgi:SAM-dependent methyltransferase